MRIVPEGAHGGAGQKGKNQARPTNAGIRGNGKKAVAQELTRTIKKKPKNRRHQRPTGSPSQGLKKGFAKNPIRKKRAGSKILHQPEKENPGRGKKKRRKTTGTVAVSPPTVKRSRRGDDRREGQT